MKMSSFVGRMALVFVLWLAGCSQTHQSTEEQVLLASNFDNYVEQAMEDWSVPGVLVIAVRPGHHAFVRSYGSRLPDSVSPINNQTLVQIASNTKAITALALGLLVEEGHLSWDDPVRHHIPEFAVADPSASEKITVRDLVSHQAGLPGTVGGFFNLDRGISEVLSVLKDRSLNPGHRQGFRYSNVGFALAGEVVSRVSGIPWADFVRSRLLDPLGMNSTFTSSTEFFTETGEPDIERNMFFPAVKDSGVVHIGSWDDIRCDEVYAPAGGILSNASDLVKWMEFLAGKGVVQGESVVASSVFEDVWKLQVEVDQASGRFDHPTAQVSYASGWASYEHGGHRVYEHGGGWMSSFIAVVPDADLSVGVFTNAFFYERHVYESLFFASALKLRMLDDLLGLPASDWSGAFEEALSE